MKKSNQRQIDLQNIYHNIGCPDCYWFAYFDGRYDGKAFWFGCRHSCIYSCVLFVCNWQFCESLIFAFFNKQLQEAYIDFFLKSALGKCLMKKSAVVLNAAAVSKPKQQETGQTADSDKLQAKVLVWAKVERITKTNAPFV